MSEAKSLTSLLREFACADEGIAEHAFVEIIRMLQPVLVKSLLAGGAKGPDAEDAAQEAMTELWRWHEESDPKRSLGSWLKKHEESHPERFLVSWLKTTAWRKFIDNTKWGMKNDADSELDGRSGPGRST